MIGALRSENQPKKQSSKGYIGILLAILFIIGFLSELLNNPVGAQSLSAKPGASGDRLSAPILQTKSREYVIVDKAYPAPLQDLPDGRNTLMRIPAGTKLEILETYEKQLAGQVNISGKFISKISWYKVKYDGKMGWISEYVTMGDPVREPIDKSKSTKSEKATPKVSVDVYAKDQKGMTALHRAVFEGELEEAEQLLARGADPNAQDKDGRTPLIWSLNRQDLKATRSKIVDLVISKGAGISTKDKEGNTPLHWAAMGGHLEAAKLLISKGSVVDARGGSDRTPLHLAASRGEVEMASLLLSKGAKVDAKSEGNTALHFAVIAGNAGESNIINVLLKNGADVNGKSDTGATPLSLAIIMKEAKAAEILRKAGGEGLAWDAVDFHAATQVAWGMQQRGSTWLRLSF